MWPLSISVGKKRRALWFSAIALGIALVVAISWLLYEYPRLSLLSDVRQSHKIIVGWRLLEKDNSYSFHAFELDKSNRAEFARTLTENLGLDYFRSQATVAPMIDIYVGNDTGVFTGYGIRRARGGGLCPSMELLRDIASKGRPLSEKERADIFTDKVPSKWPHILPWPECRYDYILPTVAGNVREENTK